jgi:hypothetical protein
VSFTRRIVWGAYGEDGVLQSTFRTAEDRTLLGIDGEVSLDLSSRIGVVHPIHLDDKTRAQWSEHMGDYEIIQPFEQLGRRLYRVEENEKGETMVQRYAESKFKSGVLRDLLIRSGWDRDTDYLRKEYDREFSNEKVVAIATMSPGVPAGEASYDIADQTIASIEFRAKKGRGKSSTPMLLSDVPPLAFTEAVHDIAEALTQSEIKE